MIEIWTVPTANGIKPILLVEEMGLPYRLHFVDMAKGEHRAPALVQLNPLGRLPVISDPDGPDGAPIALGETGAIAGYLSRKSGQLGAATSREAADIDFWVHAANATLASATARLFWLKVLAPEKVPSLIEAAERDVERFFQVFEDHLAPKGGFLAAERITIADVMFWPHAQFSAELLPGKLDSFPALKAYHYILAHRPAFARAMAAFAS
jgi:GSH-dependent disulfide-bond oxidoreductase